MYFILLVIAPTFRSGDKSRQQDLALAKFKRAGKLNLAKAGLFFYYVFADLKIGAIKNQTFGAP